MNRPRNADLDEEPAAAPAALPFHQEVRSRMTKLTRIATLTGLLAAVALPGTALGHGGGPAHDRSDTLDDSAARTQEARDPAADDRGVDAAEIEGRDDDGARGERAAARAERKADRLRRIEFRGTVKAVDADAKTVTVTVARANHGRRALRGKDVVFTIADGTRVQTGDRNADGVRDLADVGAGDRVHVVARVSRRQLASGLTTAAAQRVKVRAPNAAQPAVPPVA
jgi:hypothetical protein